MVVVLSHCFLVTSDGLKVKSAAFRPLSFPEVTLLLYAFNISESPGFIYYR